MDRKTSRRYLDALKLSDADRKKVFEGNACRAYPLLGKKLAKKTGDA